MRRLVKNQAVRVDLDVKVDWEVNCIECRVQSVQGPVATLIPQGEIPEEVQTRLASGSLCFLTFEHGRAPVALRGVALKEADRDELEFVVVDGIQVAERRSAERTPAGHRREGDAGRGRRRRRSDRVDGHLQPQHGRRPAAQAPGPRARSPSGRWRSSSPASPSTCTARRCWRVRPRRTSASGFINVQEADQLRIAGVLAGLQRATPALA